MFGILLALLQGVGVVLLTIAGMRLGRDRWVFLALGAILLLAATGLDRLAAQRENAELEIRVDELYEKLSHVVMIVPKAQQRSSVPEPSGKIQILEPLDKALVGPRQLVTIADGPERQVRIVVHPLDTGAYWVQPIPTLREDGRWSVLAYFGRSGDLDTGKVFEVMAIADPDQPLEEGTVLEGWPKAGQRSSTVTVTRR